VNDADQRAPHQPSRSSLEARGNKTKRRWHQCTQAWLMHRPWRSRIACHVNTRVAQGCRGKRADSSAPGVTKGKKLSSTPTDGQEGMAVHRFELDIIEMFSTSFHQAIPQLIYTPQPCKPKIFPNRDDLTYFLLHIGARLEKLNSTSPFDRLVGSRRRLD
jgi:hypothetical protein